LTGRILAIDYGLRRIGLAVSDALGLTAQGLPTLERGGIRKVVEQIRELAAEYSVEKVIVGNPVGHTGGETAMSKRVAEFATRLRTVLECPVVLWDERLTSAEANRMLRSAGLSIEKRRQAADRVSAVLLLQNYLDRLACERDRAGGNGEGP
jgi:putative pre-16S rRNA nuclease